MVLKTAYGLDDPMDPAAAVALNGGIAYSGGMCGALTGAALAVGMLAERRIHDHAGPSGWRASSSPRRSTRSARSTGPWTAATSSATTCARPAATTRSSPAASGATAACGRSSPWSGAWPALADPVAWDDARSARSRRARRTDRLHRWWRRTRRIGRAWKSPPASRREGSALARVRLARRARYQLHSLGGSAGSHSASVLTWSSRLEACRGIEGHGLAHRAVRVERDVRRADGVDAAVRVVTGTRDAFVVDVLALADEGQAVGVRVADLTGRLADRVHGRRPVAGLVRATGLDRQGRLDHEVVGRGGVLVGGVVGRAGGDRRRRSRSDRPTGAGRTRTPGWTCSARRWRSRCAFCVAMGSVAQRPDELGLAPAGLADPVERQAGLGRLLDERGGFHRPRLDEDGVRVQVGDPLGLRPIRGLLRPGRRCAPGR